LRLAVMGICFAAVSALAEAPITAGHAAALAGIALELAVVVALALLFSAITTPMLASFFTAGLWLIGNLTRDLRALGEQADAAAVTRVTQFMSRSPPALVAPYT